MITSLGTVRATLKKTKKNTFSSPTNIIKMSYYNLFGHYFLPLSYCKVVKFKKCSKCSIKNKIKILPRSDKKRLQLANIFLVKKCKKKSLEIEISMRENLDEECQSDEENACTLLINIKISFFALNESSSARYWKSSRPYTQFSIFSWSVQPAVEHTSAGGLPSLCDCSYTLT